MDPIQEKRLAAMQAIVEGCDEPWYTAEEVASWDEQPGGGPAVVPTFRNSSEEDLAQLLAEIHTVGFSLTPYLAVTESNDSDNVISYFYPCDTLAEAQAKATENVDDGIYRETPVAVFNLDTGERHTAVAAYVWRAAEEPSAAA